MIRSVEPKDAKDIANIYNDYILHSVATFEIAAISSEEMGKRISEISACYPYLVYEAEGQVIGYAYAHRWKERAAYRHTWETTVYVAPRFAHQGIGKRLMEQLIEACRKGDCHTLIACITGENTASLALHSGLGFKKVSLFKEVGMKFGRYLDVIDMELMCSPQIHSAIE
ncbi:MAG: N-acetyltransferase family protein [Paraprevotella sp.]|nr:N-acetyltransferase family protein [Paraprevotella sp.]